jgi:hypothetical protein
VQDRNEILILNETGLNPACLDVIHGVEISKEIILCAVMFYYCTSFFNIGVFIQVYGVHNLQGV